MAIYLGRYLPKVSGRHIVYQMLSKAKSMQASAASGEYSKKEAREGVIPHTSTYNITIP